MARFRTTFEVEWNKDMVPGFNYEIEDFQRMFKKFIEDTAVSYNPTVKIIENSVKIFDDGIDFIKMSVAKEFE